jgi:diguanylate cyclase (GGDEF)-like protein
MKAVSDRFCNHLFYILIVMELSFLVVISNYDHEKMSFTKEPIYEYNHNWIYIDDLGKNHDINLPVSLEAGEDKTVSIQKTLPDDIKGLPYIFIQTSHQNIIVYVNNHMIYNTFVMKTNGSIQVPYKNIWNIIKLPSDAYGKVIRLDITANYSDYAGNLNGVFIGSKSAFLIHMFRTNAFTLIISITILIIGTVLIILYNTLKRSLDTYKAILHLGRFCITIATWMIMESGMAQLFIDNQAVVSAITYMSLVTIPIPLIQHISTMESYKFKKITRKLNYAFYANAYIMILLQLLSIKDFHETLLPYHILSFIIYTVIIIFLLIDVFKNKNSNLNNITVACSFLFVFAIIEYILYIFKYSLKTGSVIQIGFLLFVIILSYGSIKKAIHIFQLSESAKYYEYIAKFDYMTKCKNRTAYTNDLSKLIPTADTVVLMSDVNNLKYINDNYGHQIGDDAIVRCGQFLLQVFEELGICYRIGGDEFVFVGQGITNEVIRSRVDEFFQVCKTFSLNSDYPLEVSVGHAFFDDLIDKDIFNTVKRADIIMYKYKDKTKNKY